MSSTLLDLLKKRKVSTVEVRKQYKKREVKRTVAPKKQKISTVERKRYKGDAIQIKREVLETIYYLLSGKSIRASKLEVLKAIRSEVDKLIEILEGASE